MHDRMPSLFLTLATTAQKIHEKKQTPRRSNYLATMEQIHWRNSLLHVVLLISALFNPPFPVHAATRSLVQDINPAGDLNPGVVVPFSGRLYFIADDGTHGYELMVYRPFAWPTFLPAIHHGDGA